MDGTTLLASGYVLDQAYQVSYEDVFSHNRALHDLPCLYCLTFTISLNQTRVYPIYEISLMKAGVRLAALLNDALGGVSPVAGLRM